MALYPHQFSSPTGARDSMDTRSSVGEANPGAFDFNSLLNRPPNGALPARNSHYPEGMVLGPSGLVLSPGQPINESFGAISPTGTAHAIKGEEFHSPMSDRSGFTSPIIGGSMTPANQHGEYDSPATSSGGENDVGSPNGITGSEDGDKNKQCECKDCGKTFNSVWYLKQHAVKHSSERPFKCKFCHKTYRFRSNLYQHKCPDRDKTLGPRGSSVRGPRQGGLARRQHSEDSLSTDALSSPSSVAFLPSEMPQMTESEISNNLRTLSTPEPFNRPNGKSPGTSARGNKLANRIASLGETGQDMNGDGGKEVSVSEKEAGHSGKTKQPQTRRKAARSKSEGSASYSKAEVSQYIERFRHQLQRCQKCRLYFPSREYLTRHMASHEFVETRIKCLHCSESFQNERDYAQHKQRHAPTSQHICPSCNGKFRSRLTLKRHLSMCKPTNKFKASTPVHEFGFIDQSPPHRQEDSQSPTLHVAENGPMGFEQNGDVRVNGTETPGQSASDPIIGNGGRTADQPMMNGFSELSTGENPTEPGNVNNGEWDNVSLGDFEETVEIEIMGDSGFEDQATANESELAIEQDKQAKDKQSEQTEAQIGEAPPPDAELRHQQPIEAYKILEELAARSALLPPPLSDQSAQSQMMSSQGHVLSSNFGAPPPLVPGNPFLAHQMPGVPYRPMDRAVWTPSPDTWEGGFEPWPPVPYPGYVGGPVGAVVQPRPVYQSPFGPPCKFAPVPFLRPESPMEANFVPIPVNPWEEPSLERSAVPKPLGQSQPTLVEPNTEATTAVSIGTPQRPSTLVPPELEASPGRMGVPPVPKPKTKPPKRRMATTLLCLECGKTFRNMNSMKTHLVFRHASLPRGRTTARSRQRAGRKRAVKRILRTAKRISKVPKVETTRICFKCGAIMANKRLLNYHMMVEHRENRPFVCNICHRGFKYGSNLKDHLTTHENFKRYDCEKCGRGFRLKTNWSKHLLICKGAEHVLERESRKAAKLLRKQIRKVALQEKEDCARKEMDEEEALLDSILQQTTFDDPPRPRLLTQEQVELTVDSNYGIPTVDFIEGTVPADYDAFLPGEFGFLGVAESGNDDAIYGQPSGPPHQVDLNQEDEDWFVAKAMIDMAHNFQPGPREQPHPQPDHEEVTQQPEEPPALDGEPPEAEEDRREGVTFLQQDIQNLPMTGETPKTCLRAKPGPKPSSRKVDYSVLGTGKTLVNDGNERSIPHLPDQIVVPGMKMAVILEAKMMADQYLTSSSGSLSSDMSALIGKNASGAKTSKEQIIQALKMAPIQNDPEDANEPSSQPLQSKVANEKKRRYKRRNKPQQKDDVLENLTEIPVPEAIEPAEMIMTRKEKKRRQNLVNPASSIDVKEVNVASITLSAKKKRGRPRKCLELASFDAFDELTESLKSRQTTAKAAKRSPKRKNDEETLTEGSVSSEGKSEMEINAEKTAEVLAMMVKKRLRQRQRASPATHRQMPQKEEMKKKPPQQEKRKKSRRGERETVVINIDNVDLRPEYKEKGEKDESAVSEPSVAGVRRSLRSAKLAGVDLGSKIGGEVLLPIEEEVTVEKEGEGRKERDGECDGEEKRKGRVKKSGEKLEKKKKVTEGKERKETTTTPSKMTPRHAPRWRECLEKQMARPSEPTEPDWDGLWPCPLCPKRFDSRGRMRQHLAFHNKASALA